MTDDCARLITAARVPSSLAPQAFGMWRILRHDLTCPPWDYHRKRVGFDTLTLLRRCSLSTMHLPSRGWEIVMEDSIVELKKHLPIFRRASGRILVTGLGLGCVVRGLLAKPAVTHIDVVEIDRDIIRIIGAEFAGLSRVTIHHGDALAASLPGPWDFAWHDLWTDGDEHLQCLHAKLFVRFSERCGWQGAWHFPGNLAREMLPYK